MTYEIACGCGHPNRGDRRPRHQLIACGSCGRPLLVFPRSPYAAAVPPPAAAAGWRVPLVLGLSGIAILAIAAVVALPLLSRRPASDEDSDGDGVQTRAQLEAGRRALADGKYHRAATELAAALRRRDGMAPLSAAERRQLVQWHRQADLLAHLSQATLEEIVAQGKLVRDPAEWEALFALHHRGRGVLFDDRVRRDAAGRPALAHHVVTVGDETVRVALDDLPLFADLPLVDEPRLIFGARLAGCVREQGGGWVVHLQPNSEVLLTDPAAAEACLPRAAEDDLRPTLEWQQRWLDQLDGGR